MKPGPDMPAPLTVELQLQRPGLDIQVQFRVPAGHVCALVGHPGSGKTAVLQAAAGLLPARGGRVTLGAHVLFDAPGRVNQPPEQRRFAWVDGRGHLFAHLTVRQNLAYGLDPAVPAAAKRQAVSEAAEQFGLGPVLERHPKHLDVPLRQRVALARALLSRPRALVLHDPLAEVAPQDRDTLLDVLQHHLRRQRLPVLLSSPRMDEVIRLADDLVIVHEGRVAGAGPVNRMLSDVSMATFLEGVHAGSVLDGVVRQHDIQWLLSEVDVAGQRVAVPAVLASEGQHVRLKIRARDVSIHRQAIADSGQSNQLRGRITQVMLAGDHGSFGAVAAELERAIDAHGHVEAGEQIWALMTRRSIQQMGLAPGQDCHISFKSMAVSVATR